MELQNYEDIIFCGLRNTKTNLYILAVTSHITTTCNSLGTKNHGKPLTE